MKVWVLTYNDGDYYSTYDEYLSVHATKDSAKAAGTAHAEEQRKYYLNWHPRQDESVGEWVLTAVADSFRVKYVDPEMAELHYRGHTWYVTPEEVQL